MKISPFIQNEKTRKYLIRLIEDVVLMRDPTLMYCIIDTFPDSIA